MNEITKLSINRRYLVEDMRTLRQKIRQFEKAVEPINKFINKIYSIHYIPKYRLVDEEMESCGCLSVEAQKQIDMLTEIKQHYFDKIIGEKKS